MFLSLDRKYILYSDFMQREIKDFLTSRERASLESRSKAKKGPGYLQILFGNRRHICISVVLRYQHLNLCALMSNANCYLLLMQLLLSPIVPSSLIL